jgi:hypothetical protein
MICVGVLVIYCLTATPAQPAVVDTLSHARVVELPDHWKAECIDERGFLKARGTIDEKTWQACANVAGNNKIIKRRKADRPTSEKQADQPSKTKRNNFSRYRFHNN